jgi:tRNA A37 threonylcarbamoyladenosine dehydratase
MGQEKMDRLWASRVAVFGVGGVGGYVCEALIRSGVGSLDIVDHDTVDITNINRQIIATTSVIGRYKVEVMKERLLDISPDATITAYNTFFLPDNAKEFDFSKYDYVVDAVDTVTAKLEIIRCAKEAGTPVISAMGAGNKLDPTAFRVADIYDTKVCPLARVMRRELKKRGIDSLKVVYSEEEPKKNPEAGSLPGSVAFVPSVAGLVIAGEVVKDIR